MITAAVLFARADSIYKQIYQADVYDEARDARTFPGGVPVIAHPPCRAWGRLRTFANPAPHEKDLARWAVLQIRTYGGVLEHPAGSTLWEDQGLPRPGAPVDAWGGWTLEAPQKWWGHRAEKNSWFYIVGCPRSEIPALPLVLGDATHVVQSMKDDHRPHIPKAEQEKTPIKLAVWLMELAKIIGDRRTTIDCQLIL